MAFNFKNWLHLLAGNLFEAKRSGRGRTIRRGQARLLLEVLEARLVPTSILVNSAADPAGFHTTETLRDAISRANADAAAGISDAITFDTAAMGTGTITLSQGSLDLMAGTGQTSIAGGGQVTIDGNQAISVFQFDAGANDVLTGLTIQHGQGSLGTGSDNGGGIFNSGTLALSNCILQNNSAAGNGAGIFNSGTLALSNCILLNNGATGDGAGIFNSGTLTASNCTISGNSANGGGGVWNTGTATLASSTLLNNHAVSTSGGGIDNAGGALSLNNSTVTGNTAPTGGGFFNDTGSNLNLSNGTVSANTATGGAGGGIVNNAGTLTLESSIVAGNSASTNANIGGTFSGSNNLTSGTPDLNAPATNGGPTDTMSEQTSPTASPALGAGGAVTTVGAAGITSITATSISVTDAATIARTPGSYLIRIDSEDMLVTNVDTTANTLTVVRGYNGTTAATHAAAAGVFFLLDQRGYAFSGTPDIGAYQSNGTAPATPTVTSIYPIIGPLAGGTVVTITGTNLGNATSVQFGVITGTIVSDSGTVIQAVAPAETPGMVDVTVTTVGYVATATSPADQYQFAGWANGAPATLVLGQTTFMTNTGATTAAGLLEPSSVAVDPTTGKVFVADLANHRVLRYASAATLLNGAPAEAVLGQVDLTSDAMADTQAGMGAPAGIFVDSTGTLWVADQAYNRVLRYDNASSLTSGANASGVLGQASFTTSAPGDSQNSMSTPTDVAVDAAGTLWVADADNNRVLRFDNAASKTNGANADGVLGQTNFTSNGPATSQSGMRDPHGVYVDAAGTLWVADADNNRVLRFDDAAAKSDGANANGVLGQTDFNTGTGGGVTQSAMTLPISLTGDPLGRLYVADYTGDRVLIFNDAAAKTDGANADFVLGQPNFATGAVGGVSASSLAGPYGLTFDVRTRTLFVADAGDNRVLGYAAPPLPPTVTTPTKSSMETTATLGGTLSNSGGASILKRGILYAKTSDDSSPQLGDGKAMEVDDMSLTTGPFTEPITGLSPNTGYSFVAFAMTSFYTTYTSPATFTTEANPTVKFSAASETVNQSAGAFSITVCLSYTADQNVSVPFTLGGTAVAGTDYSGLTVSPLIISAGHSSATITGTLLRHPGSSKTLTFTLKSPTNATLGSTTLNTLTMNEPPALGALATTTGTVQVSFSATITLTGGIGTLSNLSVTGLPPGLTAKLVLTKGVYSIVISGKPTTAGTFKNIMVSVHDGVGDIGMGTYSLTINNVVPWGQMVRK